MGAINHEELSTQDVQIGIRAGQVDLKLLNLLALQDRTSNSAVLRRLIHEEARRRGLVNAAGESERSLPTTDPT